MYVDVVVDIEGAGAPGALTYLVPEALQASVGVGAYVRVPLGAREVLGYVVGLKQSFTGEGVKPITALVHTDTLFDSQLLSLARWMTRRYFSSLSEVLRCIVPEGLATRLRTLVALQDIPDPEALANSFAKRAPVLSRLIRELAAQESTDLRVLRGAWEGSSLSSALSRLRARGWLQETVELESKPARAQQRRAFAAALPAAALIAEAEARRKRAPAQAQALQFFAARGDTPFIAAEAVSAGLSAAALKVLARDGLLQESSLTVRRDPWHGSKTRTTPPPLTAGQQHAVDVITETLATGQHDTILLHGVTASGKTEVYLHAIDATLASGRDAIVLLPEISLTAQVVDVFKSRLGDRVALLHSRLSAGERYDEWRRLRAGEAQVAVGPRSALFAPCRKPGLIILDEEHEPSYKQETDPRYHARRAARERAKLADAVLVLGSATPSVESYYLASTGEYRLAEMPERIHGRALPKSTVVDLRASGDKAKVEIFSEALLDGLADRLRRGEQSILFLNRRGFASFILCRECGYTAQCPHCSVALTLHVSDRSLRCHHCNYRRPAPTVCPNCNGARIYPFGLGTERLEAEARTRFPEARVLRMDRDTTSTKNAHSRLYRAFRQGEADILIGTQMVAKGLDFPGVTLVGVIAADMGLNVPDFRAAERTFQLLTQVAGRAGRGEQPGEVLFQTFNPDHYAITTARDQDYAGFYAREIDFRRELGYPPFGALVNLISTDTDAQVAETRAHRAVAAVAHVAKREKWNVEVLGPSPAPLARLKRRFRWHAIVRGPEEAQVHAAVRAGIEALPNTEQNALTVDVDPYGMA